MLTSLYLLNEKNEKLDLLCSPFWLEQESFKQEYSQTNILVNSYQYIHNTKKRTLNNFQFQLEGTAFKIGESKKVDNFVNNEHSSFRLVKVDDAGDEHFCDVVLSSYATSRIASTDKFIQLLVLDKVSNWQREVSFNSIGNDSQQVQDSYDYVYSLQYQQERLSDNYNPSEQISVSGNESAPFVLVFPKGGTNIKWECYSEDGKLVGKGKLLGTYSEEVIVDTRHKTQGIYVGGKDRRDARDITSDYDHFFNLPQGKNIINVSGVGDSSWRGFFVEQDRLVTSNEY